jgi:hypothetical protein
MGPPGCDETLLFCANAADAATIKAMTVDAAILITPSGFAAAAQS